MYKSRHRVLLLSLLLSQIVSAAQAIPVFQRPGSPELALQTQTPLNDSKPLFEVIRPGMERWEVEAFLKDKDYGPQSESSTRYSEKGYLIVVPFDEKEGFWSPHNQVNGLATLTHTRWRRIRSSKL